VRALDRAAALCAGALSGEFSVLAECRELAARAATPREEFAAAVQRAAQALVQRLVAAEGELPLAGDDVLCPLLDEVQPLLAPFDAAQLPSVQAAAVRRRATHELAQRLPGYRAVPAAAPRTPGARLSAKDWQAWPALQRSDVDDLTGYPRLVVHEATGIVLVLIPAGQFVMGSPPEEPGRKDDEVQHPRAIRRAFYLGETEVTQGQWNESMGANPSADRSPVDNHLHPVTRVGVGLCTSFVGKAGGELRLPSEAEWEYACRAGTTTTYWFGDVWAHRADAGCFERESTLAVGKTGPNPWGLRGMLGGVWELCGDSLTSYPGQGDERPVLGAKSEDRVVRGGSYQDTDAPAACRSAKRGGIGPEEAGGRHGLRVARSLPD
jgi:formylglycine-generating enzyme required for sulfatase activity